MGGGVMQPIGEKQKWVIVLEIEGKVDEGVAGEMSRMFHRCLEDFKAIHGVSCRIVYNAKGETRVHS